MLSVSSTFRIHLESEVSCQGYHSFFHEKQKCLIYNPTDDLIVHFHISVKSFVINSHFMFHTGVLPLISNPRANLYYWHSQDRAKCSYLKRLIEAEGVEAAYMELSC